MKMTVATGEEGKSMRAALRSVCFAGLIAVTGCGAAVNGDVTATREGGSTVNGSVRVPAGMQVGPVSSVNGSIKIEDGATVSSAHAVNGEIEIGAHATVASVVTVNGSITLGDGAHVTGDAKTVNGEVELHKDSEVGGAVKTASGTIDLQDARVRGELRTMAANIEVSGASHVDGGILVEKNTTVFTSSSFKPRIVIGPGAEVQGPLRFERDVQLYVSDKATIGPVTGATAIPYAGDKPPG
jgi:DUF4097 and DUF4098 domain-containing protein YvlB